MDEVERFRAAVQRAPGPVPLDVACMLVAAALDPGIDVDAELDRIDALADGVVGTSLAAVAHHLFRVEGFDGDRDTYYDPANSLLPQVLDRRRGIPITLAVLTLEVARRVGAPAVGVGMPGHFLIGDPTDGDSFIDGFSGGVLIDRAATRRLFAHIHGDRLPFDDGYLAASSPVEVLARVLANLRQIYTTRGQGRQLARVLELRCALPGAPVDDRTALADALAAVGRFTEAADVLDDAADSAPGPVAQRLETSARHLRARLN